MSLTALPVDAAVPAVNQTTNYYSVNGDGLLTSGNTIYTCPADRRAKFGVLFYNNAASNSLTVHLHDDLTHWSTINEFTVHYNSALNHFKHANIATSYRRPWDTEQWGHGYDNTYIPSNIHIFPGQVIKCVIYGSSIWRFVYRIIEEDM